MGDVEDVVDYLKRQPDVLAKIGQRLELTGCAVGGHTAEFYGTGQQRGGFALVNVSKLGTRHRLPLTFEVGHLSSDQLGVPSSLGQFTHEIVLLVTLGWIGLIGQLESQSEQGIPGQHRDALPINDVIGFVAAPVIVVVQGRKVVMNQ